ncbi:MAG: hypothetical protein DMG91_17970 [Acidobacteria bacterium]|nr:MAG: hypothetical protein DMG91_17970 [Acidobacteriota bacterium]
MKKCAFCDAEAVRKGGEHVWDDWLNRALPRQRYKARKRYSLHSPVIEYAAAKFDVKFAVVCAECNNGWMSDLTTKIKNCFSRAMLNGEPFSLDTRNSALLAAFTFMKAAVTNYEIDDDPFFTRAARENLRTSLTIPPFIKMWTAAYQGAARMSAKNHLYIVSPKGKWQPFYGMEFCSFTYVVGKLAVQLLAPRWRHIYDRGRPMLTITPNVMWRPATIQFWPYASNVSSWPPEKYLGEEIIESFIYRFNVPINVPIP